MKIIGLTGGTGSGKGVVSRLLFDMGAFIIDSDKIAHDIILKGKPAYNELVGYFGSSVLDGDGEIIRKKLGEIVFKDKGEKLDFLNSRTHKYIFEEISMELKKAESEGKTAVIDAPLLLEGNFKSLCTEVWVVYADESTRLKRIIERDKIDVEHGKNRIASQKPWSYYESHADVVIYNSGSIDDLKEQVYKYYKP